MSRSILALTFTNKAAREMKERIARGAERARYRWGLSILSFSRILRTEAVHIIFVNFTIYDAAELEKV